MNKRNQVLAIALHNIKSLTSLEIDITGMMKRHQHITKVQSELIQEKSL